MLNRLRIGTKLFSGFAIVLILLVAVWLVGWYATSQIVGKTNELNTASDQSQRNDDVERYLCGITCRCERGSL